MTYHFIVMSRAEIQKNVTEEGRGGSGGGEKKQKRKEKGQRFLLSPLNILTEQRELLNYIFIRFQGIPFFLFYHFWSFGILFRSRSDNWKPTPTSCPDTLTSYLITNAFRNMRWTQLLPPVCKKLSLFREILGGFDCQTGFVIAYPSCHSVK